MDSVRAWLHVPVSHSHTHSLTHSLPAMLHHCNAPSLQCSITAMLHHCNAPLILVTVSLCHCVTVSLTHSLILVTVSLCHSLTHSLTHSRDYDTKDHCAANGVGGMFAYYGLQQCVHADTGSFLFSACDAVARMYTIEQFADDMCKDFVGAVTTNMQVSE